MDNLLQYIDEQRQCKDLQNTIDIQEILKQYPETSYLSDQTLESLQKEIIDSFRLYYSAEFENSCISKLNEYRLIENICHLHKGKYIRWIRLNQEKPILTNGGIVMDVKFLDNGIHVLCKSKFKFIQYKFDECLTFQKLNEDELMILGLQSFASTIPPDG